MPLIDILAAGVTDDSGVVLASGTVTSYQAGTTTLQTIYQDNDLTIPHSNPSTLDSAGRLIAYSATSLKLVIETSAGASVRTIDNVSPDNQTSGVVVTRGSDADSWGAATQDAINILVSDSLGVDAQFKAADSATARDYTDKAKEIISAFDYGAVADGTTSDATALSNAIGALGSGGTLFIPEGTYIVDTTITVTTSNIRIMGSGDKTILKASGTVDPMILMQNITDITIENIQFQGSRSDSVIAQECFAIGTVGNPSERVYIRNCKFSGPSDGTGFNIPINCQESHYCVFDSCYFERVQGTGSGFGYGIIINNDADANKVTNCTFNFVEAASFGGRHAVYVSVGASQNVVANNWAKFTDSAAFTMNTTAAQNTSKGNRFIGNYVLQTNQHGISCVGNQEDNIISNNVIDDVQEDGIHIEGNSGAAGIPTRLIISGNTIKDCQDYGIQGLGLNDCLISGNIIRDVSQSLASSFSGIEISDNSSTPTVGLRNSVIGNHISQSATVAGLSGIRITPNTQNTHTQGNHVNLTNMTGVGIDDLSDDSSKSAGNTPYKVGMVQSTSNVTLTVAQSGGIYTNGGAIATMTYTLPSVEAGLQYTFYVTASGQELRIDPNAADIFRGYTTTAGEYLTSSTQGDSITIVGRGSTNWMVVSEMGSWTNQTSASERHIVSDTVTITAPATAINATSTAVITAATATITSSSAIDLASDDITLGDTTSAKVTWQNTGAVGLGAAPNLPANLPDGATDAPVYFLVKHGTTAQEYWLLGWKTS